MFKSNSNTNSSSSITLPECACNNISLISRKLGMLTFELLCLQFLVLARFIVCKVIPALLSPLPLIPSTTEEITGYTNEAAQGANKAGRNPPPCFLFHVLLF